MTQELKEQIQNLFLRGSLRILKDYTDSALLINSCHLAIERYSDMLNPVHLSTTANIPGPLRLDVEFEEELHNEALVERYSTDAQRLVFEQYISNCVSVIDGVFEDIYEVLLTEFEDQISEKRINDRIRSAWAQNALVDYFLEKTNLNDPNNPDRQIKGAFDRYKEFRILRHALIHNNGTLSDKHIRQLDEIADEETPENQYKTMRKSPFYEKKRIDLELNTFLSLRKFLYELMGYFSNAFN
jgi:hypothetical protein